MRGWIVALLVLFVVPAAGAQQMRQLNTATYHIPITMIQTSDHITGITGATVTCTCSKNAGTYATCTGAVTEIANGDYKLAANATDTNTLGTLKIHCTATSADPTDTTILVVAFDPFSATNLGLSALPTTAAGANGGLPLGVDSSGRVDVLKVNGTSQTARDLGAQADVATSTRMASYTQPTGFLATTFPSGTVASTTNLTAGTIATVANPVTLSAGDSPVIQTGTASAGGASTITIATALGADSLPNGETITITSGTGVGQTRGITGYVNSTKVVTTDRAWTTNPDATSVYAIRAGNAAKLDSSLQVTAASVQGNVTGSVGSVTGLTASNLDTTVSSRMATYTQPTGFLAATFPATVASTTNITAGTITTCSTTSAVGSGAIAASSFAAGAIDAAAIATDAIGSAELAASAVTEIQAGLSTYAGGDTSGTTTLLSRIPGTVQPQTGDSYARLGAPSGASIDADILTRLATSGYTAAPTAAQIWGTDISNATTYPSPAAAAYLRASGSASDPWLASLPGSYTSGQAGYIIGHSSDPWATEINYTNYPTAGTAGYDLTAIYGKTATLGGATCTTTNPVASNGAISLSRGVDYLETDGRALSFASITGFPSFASGTATLVLRYSTGAAGPTYTCSIITPASPATIHCDVTRTQTSALTQASYGYALKVTLASASVIEVQRGTVTVRDAP